MIALASITREWTCLAGGAGAGDSLGATGAIAGAGLWPSGAGASGLEAGASIFEL